MPAFTMFWLLLFIAFFVVTGRMETFIDLLRKAEVLKTGEDIKAPPGGTSNTDSDVGGGKTA